MEPILGCFNRPWGPWPLERALAGIAQAGFTGVGLLRQQGELVVSADSLPQEVGQVAGTILSYGLTPVTFLSRTGAQQPLTEALAHLRREIDNVCRLGAGYLLHCGVAQEDLYDQFYEVMRQGAAYAQARGVQIVLKPHGGVSATAADCVRAVEAVNSPAFRIWYDPGNVLFYTGADPAEDVAAVAPYVTGVCVKDCQGGTVQVTPGEGEVNFARLFDTLLEAGFSGPCLVECLVGETPEEVDAAAAVVHERLRKWLRL
ncbi:MAG TPA: sugar phosphate isomerase/epimerase [Armatimonadetes bacterium]|nr:sugar phosphate isomerase/epimerase [Armatimonadota bacterium]